MNSPLMSGGYPFPAGSDVLGPVSGDRLFGGGLRLTMSALVRITDSRGHRGMSEKGQEATSQTGHDMKEAVNWGSLSSSCMASSAYCW
jgi:hypothetical protein